MATGGLGHLKFKGSGMSGWLDGRARIGGVLAPGSLGTCEGGSRGFQTCLGISRVKIGQWGRDWGMGNVGEAYGATWGLVVEDVAVRSF